MGLKFAAVACVLVFATILWRRDPGVATANFSAPFSGETGDVAAFTLAMIAAMWSFDGFSDVGPLTGPVSLTCVEKGTGWDKVGIRCGGSPQRPTRTPHTRARAHTHNH